MCPFFNVPNNALSNVSPVNKFNMFKPRIDDFIAGIVYLDLTEAWGQRTGHENFLPSLTSWSWPTFLVSFLSLNVPSQKELPSDANFSKITKYVSKKYTLTFKSTFFPLSSINQNVIFLYELKKMCE